MQELIEDKHSRLEVTKPVSSRKDDTRRSSSPTALNCTLLGGLNREVVFWARYPDAKRKH